jgi:hypothetical protein
MFWKADGGWGGREMGFGRGTSFNFFLADSGVRTDLFPCRYADRLASGVQAADRDISGGVRLIEACSY